MITLADADITTLEVDAIVNAANAALRGGGGVDGAIHRAAGPKLMDACRAHGHCPPGGAVVTEGFDLPATWVIHAVGPIWQGGTHDEPDVLRSTYLAALTRAREIGARRIAFPAISCGTYGYPIPEATAIAVATIREFVEPGLAPDEVTICCFGSVVREAYERELAST